ncbi:MAG: phosphate ABC transporter substrate-binding protein [Anaerolineae bacterium]|nr:phosphate ABC transporter substrate-binding protein [Ardenticatenia bacterium]MBK8538567.1 phosphate ABC transporter substrate-binding protein [Ardenticatenia bacterium]HQZ71390.1 phosphate ABC transporter substrate-binding protein [Anaerolineae bacterium]
MHSARTYPRRRLSWVRLATMLALGLLNMSCGGGRSDTGEAVRMIQNTGSDTMLQLAQAWAETYGALHPELSIAVTGGGSGAGIAALINGTTEVANASRRIKDEEVAKLPSPPQEHQVAVDALAVIVHPDNPVSQLTLRQLSDVYQGKVTNWRQLGGLDAPIILLSRETNSGTHVYFLEEVLRLGDKESTDIFASQTLLMPSSVGITSEIRRNPNAIGYDGLGYVTAEEKVLALADSDDGRYVRPSVATARDGSYPLARGLFLYTSGQERAEVKDYIAWIMGDDGQAIVARLGFVASEK